MSEFTNKLFFPKPEDFLLHLFQLNQTTQMLEATLIALCLEMGCPNRFVAIDFISSMVAQELLLVVDDEQTGLEVFFLASVSKN